MSDYDGDLSILRSSKKTYSRVRESCDSGNEKSFSKSTTNTKSIASSSLSHKNKIINVDPLISGFDNDENKCSASGCDFSKELLSPTYPDKTYQQTRKNSNDKIDLLEFVRRYSVARNLEYINSRKSEIAPKSTGAEKGCNKSEECQKSNNTVVEMSTIRNRFNHGNFKQIKRPDIDKRSMQKSLWRSHDKSNSGSSVQHSSSLPSFVTQSSEIHSTENSEVAQSNTIRASHLLNRLKDLSDDLKCNRACDNPFDDLRHNLMSHSTVKENLSICTFGAKETETKTLNIVKIKLKNRDDPNLRIEIEAVETEYISITNLPTPDRNIDKKFRYLKNVQLADPYEFNDKEISILIGADYYYQLVTGRITRLNKNLVTVGTLFGWSLQGQSTDSEELLTMSVIVNESNISKQLSEFWDLENLGIEAAVSDEENIDNNIMSKFEARISYQNKRYKVKFPWKPNMKTLLENNEEIARKRFLKLRSSFKNDSSLFEDYKLVVNNYLSEKIIERVPFEEENLKHNICIYHIEQ
ncbi:DUF1758 domain-containing protein [Trichonephila clavipes]|nr:DUF1758 domain-containing protein [Trichonephila clavipes]